MANMRYMNLLHSNEFHRYEPLMVGICVLVAFGCVYRLGRLREKSAIFHGEEIPSSQREETTGDWYSVGR
jgi:hypothetical protein